MNDFTKKTDEQFGCGFFETAAWMWKIGLFDAKGFSANVA